MKTERSFLEHELFLLRAGRQQEVKRDIEDRLVEITSPFGRAGPEYLLAYHGTKT